MTDTRSEPPHLLRETIKHDNGFNGLRSLLEEEVIREGDYVLIYIDERRTYIVRVERDRRFESDKGVLELSDLIGLPYGSRVELSTGVKAFVLKPLFHDFFMKYKRRTQVIYPKDLGFIVFLSGISSGSRVLEAGVGTGFLTTTLAHIVKPNGRVYAYEIRRDFYENALRNLKISGLLRYVDLRLGSVKRAEEELEGLDAAFLDLADPWNYIKIVYKVVKPSASTIFFVPTVNQVEKTVLALKEHGGFTDIHAYELLLREYQVKENATRPRPFMIGHTGYIVFARRILLE